MKHLSFAARQTPLAALGLAAALALPASAIAQGMDEHPDFTGVWTSYRPGPGAPGLGGGTAIMANQPQLTEDGQARVDAFRALVNGTDYSPGAYCVGTGMPGSMLGSGPYPMEIIQRPEQVTVIYEAHTEVRRLFVGDRAAEIDPMDVFPERDGFSVAHWEGDTLVVNTDHLVEQVDTRYPHSDQAKVVERYSLSTEDVGEGEPPKRVLTAEMTMTDPVFLTEPYVTTKKWQHAPQGRLLNYECTETQWLDAIEQLKAGGHPPLPLGAEAPDN
jgi:hypothetical protein